MNVIILAGGYAQRLWPLTEEFPKVLLKIGGKEILFHLLCNIQDIPKINSITIAIDENKQEYFNDFLRNIKLDIYPNIKLSIHSLVQGKIVGPVSKLYHILMESSYKKTENFLVIGGDNFFGFSLKEFTDFFNRKNQSIIAIHEEVKIADGSQFGIPKISSDGTISEFWEKQNIKQVNFVSTACYLFKYDTIIQTSKYLNALKDEESLGSFVSWLVDKKKEKILAFKFREPWYDTGTREGLLGANKAFLNNLKGTNSMGFLRGENKIRPPVFIEHDAIIKNSEIGPFVYIDHNVSIDSSKISNSIIYNQSKITKSKLLNSVVGPNSIIEGDIGEAVLGPNTRIIKDK